ncbi:MAG1430 family protein [Mycoplasmopsis hyopharyngis]|uniref:MAG1430 family protein n=1 Tax=Mycoplasmopsis hyopharyngis TaxID=29558 RepID=UPI003873A634
MNKPKIAFLITANLCALSVVGFATALLVNSKTSNKFNADNDIESFALHVNKNELDISKHYSSDFIFSDEDDVLNNLDLTHAEREESKKFWADQLLKFSYGDGFKNKKFFIQNKKGTPLSLFNKQNVKYVYNFSSFANEITGELFLRVRYYDEQYKGLTDSEKLSKKVYKYKIFKISGFKKITKADIENKYKDSLINEWPFEENGFLHDKFIETSAVLDSSTLFKTYDEFYQAYVNEKDNKLQNFIEKYFSFPQYEKKYYERRSLFKLDKNSITFSKIEGKENEFRFSYKLKYNAKAAFIDKEASVIGLFRNDESFLTFDKVLTSNKKLNFLELKKYSENIEVVPASSTPNALSQIDPRSLSLVSINSNDQLHKFQKEKVFTDFVLTYKKDTLDPTKYLPFNGTDLKPEDFKLEYDQYAPIDTSNSDYDEGEIILKYKFQIKPEREDLIKKYGSSFFNGKYVLKGFKQKPSEELFKKQLDKIIADVENKKDKLVTEVQDNDIKFSNYKSESYEVDGLTIKEQKDDYIQIAFKLKRKSDNATSEEKTIKISGFKKA